MVVNKIKIIELADAYYFILLYRFRVLFNVFLRLFFFS